MLDEMDPSVLLTKEEAVKHGSDVLLDAGSDMMKRLCQMGRELHEVISRTKDPAFGICIKKFQESYDKIHRAIGELILFVPPKMEEPNGPVSR